MYPSQSSRTKWRHRTELILAIQYNLSFVKVLQYLLNMYFR
jgi:hypothetical protein